MPFAEVNDLLDASVCALSALRILEGTARRIPEEPIRDQKGLRMDRKVKQFAGFFLFVFLL